MASKSQVMMGHGARSLAKVLVKILVKEADLMVQNGHRGPRFISQPKTHSLSMQGVAEAICQATGLIEEMALLAKVGIQSVPGHELQGSRPKLRPPWAFAALGRAAKAEVLLTPHKRDVRAPRRVKQGSGLQNLKVKEGLRVANDAQLGLVGGVSPG
jgi:hypothetical protein